MSKWFGEVGYAVDAEVDQDLWDHTLVKRNYYGDVTKDRSRWEKREHLTDDIRLNSVVSIIADAFAYESFHQIKYVTYMGVKWSVTDIDVQPPRINLTLGGVYKG